ncbi:hypothetical protein PHJA_001543400 [Phtheirospermum japonicum]|uniref:G-patch domain-containing protein n=1 Tax=Phtheirospermum japonicum TaxID=374723 RepID=A0A830C2Z9_9LAMI|nr:hypothetical protein PHJA_001543400 [Phtheirospermum japonicum]
MEVAVDEGASMGLGMSTASNTASSSSSIPIDSSNIGFQVAIPVLLKKHGWKEGTGLGVSEQGRLEPVEAFIKKNKRGLGADKPEKASKQPKNDDADDPKLPKRKAKGISKKMKKIQEFEKRLQQQEFDRDFFRMFWPDNV